MTKVSILDTGYVGLELSRGSQTQLSDANRAGLYTGGGGVIKSIELNIESLSSSRSTNTEAKPIPGTYTNSQSTLISNTNRILSVSCIIQKSVSTSEYDYGILYQLLRMEETQGLKIMYPSDTSDITGYKTIIESLGQPNIGQTTKFSASIPYDDEGTVGLTIPYVIGRAKGFTVNDNPTGTFWRVSFNFEVSG